VGEFWTDSHGIQIAYNKLVDSHLLAIIKDGYRNPNLKKEAKRRGFDYPKRLIDEMHPDDLAPKITSYIEALASCAIEGNEQAEHILWLCSNNFEAFMIIFNRDLEEIENQE